jgi:glycine cleavage system transcriptional repressor
MARKYLLTAFSEDRPGIVASISRLIYENGCNLEDSAMTNLSGEFAILLLFSSLANGDNGSLLDKMIAECRRLERDEGITAYIRPIDVDRQRPKTDIVRKTIDVEGQDQAGIVYKISRYLADTQINISHLDSQVQLSPESGAALYCMRIQVEIPKELPLVKVEEALAEIGDELNVEVTLS